MNTLIALTAAIYPAWHISSAYKLNKISTLALYTMETLTLYTILHFVGASNTIAIVPAIVCASFLTEYNIYSAFSTGVLAWYASEYIISCVIESPIILVQLLSGVVFGVIATWITELPEKKLNSGVQLSAVLLLTLLIYYASVWSINHITMYPMWSLLTIVSQISSSLLYQDYTQPIRVQIICNIIAGGVLKWSCVAMWYHPVLALAMVYTVIITHVTNLRNCLVIYFGLLAAMLAIIYYPWALIPLSLLPIYTQVRPGAPTLNALQAEHAYHKKSWQINKKYSENMHVVDEKKWHLVAEQYYRDMLNTEYFMDL